VPNKIRGGLYYNMEIENKIRLALDSVESLLIRDREFILELLDHNEWGVALEILCAVIFEDKLKISQEIYSLIEGVGIEMEMDSNNGIKAKPLE
jgi:hypothetical protein